MNGLHIYAFADEASGRMEGQIAAMTRNGLQGLEIRGVDGQNIADITPQNAREVRKKLDDAGLCVWSVGSPIGKIDIVQGDFAAHLDQLRHTLDLADILGAKNLRMFSFYLPAGETEKWRGKVFDQMGAMLGAAAGSGVTLCHENEKGIYGDNADRCHELLQAFPVLAGVFDPANFVQCNQDTLEAWDLLKDRILYLHIKDALPDGRVVPAGKGAGHVAAILKDFFARGGRHVTVEPHLSVFDGLRALERAGKETKIDPYSYPSSDAAFDAACRALRTLMEKENEQK